MTATNRPRIRTFPAIEGAQHGGKGLAGFIAYIANIAKRHRMKVIGGQPSNYMLEREKPEKNRPFRSAKEIKEMFAKKNVRLVGVSAHCPFWVLLTAWTQSKTIRPFISPELAKQSPDAIFKWIEEYLMRLLDLCAELGVKVIPMFWGVAFGWELATGYPWGFWKGGDYDLIKEGYERFARMTARLRTHAAKLGIYLCHEIHPGTAAGCADDFNMLVKACDGDKVLAVNDDPSHGWEGEPPETRARKVGERILASHVKNHVIRRGLPLRCMAPSWPDRAMQFVDLPSGDINLVRHAEVLINVGYVERYCATMGTDMAPWVCEAESAYRELDATGENGVVYIQNKLCFPIAAGSFEDGMGAEKK